MNAGSLRRTEDRLVLESQIGLHKLLHVSCILLGSFQEDILDAGVAR